VQETAVAAALAERPSELSKRQGMSPAITVGPVLLGRQVVAAAAVPGERRETLPIRPKRASQEAAAVVAAVVAKAAAAAVVAGAGERASPRRSWIRKPSSCDSRSFLVSAVPEAWGGGE
jgi:hypothetical protein